jgi:hypothetical protein
MPCRSGGRGAGSFRALTFGILACVVTAAAAAGNPYVEHRAAAVKLCEAIDPGEYQSGLLFNPDGYRSLYRRSACFQDAAVRFRDEKLCAQVKERRALLWSSWGYSAKRCRQLAAEGLEADRKALEELRSRYLKGAVRLRDFRIERNGNGRDFDIIPLFDPGYPHGYMLRFEIIDDEERDGTVLLDSSGFHLGANNNISIFVRQEEIRKRFLQFEPGRRYRVRGTITLDVGYGGQSGMRSEAFIQRVFPVAERSRFVEKDVSF